MVSPAGSRSFTSRVGRYCGRSVVLAIVRATITGTGASAFVAPVGAAPAVAFAAFASVAGAIAGTASRRPDTVRAAGSNHTKPGQGNVRQTSW